MVLAVAYYDYPGDPDSETAQRIEERTWAVIMTVALYSNGMTGLNERITSLSPGPRATTRLRKVVILFASVGIFSVCHARVR